MKKVLSLILVSALVLALSGPALALDETDPDGDVVISTTVGVTYTVTIPENTTIALNTASTDIGDITLTNAVLAPGFHIDVTVTGGDLTTAGAGNMTHGAVATTKLPFTLKIDSTAGTSTTFTANGAKQVDVDIAASAWAAAPAGSYSATLTFTVSYNNT